MRTDAKVDRRRERDDEINSRFLQSCERASKFVLNELGYQKIASVYFCLTSLHREPQKRRSILLH
jgi:hypothetical protein